MLDAIRKAAIIREARQARKRGVDDAGMQSIVEVAKETGRKFADKKPSDAYLRGVFESRLSGMGFDPATVMLIVQLLLLIYKTLEAAGYFDSGYTADEETETFLRGL